MKEAISVVFIAVVAMSVVFGFGFSFGKNAGYDRALADVKLITPPKTTDQQCVAWLFEANMKDVKKRLCK